MISIILPVYNGSDFLEDCINSILAQDFQNFELIIVNDGSTDESESVIQNVTDNRVRYFSKSNTGLADTLNFGVLKSRFDYICRIDQDDLMRPDRLSKQIDYLLNNPKKMGVCSYSLKINSEGQIVGQLKPNMSRRWSTFQRIFLNDLVHSAMMLRKKNLLSLGGYTIERDLQPPEDFELWSRYMHNYSDPFGIIPEFLTYYRITQNSMSRISPSIEQNSVSISLRNITYIADLNLEHTRILKSFLFNIHARSGSNYIFEFSVLNLLLLQIWRKVHTKYDLLTFVRIGIFQIKYSFIKPLKHKLSYLLSL
jgi:glycosyltransferase involved in cell wall biosynthesis